MSSIKALALAKAIGGGGSSIDIETLTVTENGTVTAPSGKAYGTVIVNVPPRTPRAAAPGGYNIGTFFSEYAWNSAAAQQAG